MHRRQHEGVRVGATDVWHLSEESCTYCVVFCRVGSESAAERILSVEDHHHHQDHYTKRYTGH